MKLSMTITFTALFVMVGIFYFLFGSPALPKTEKTISSGTFKLLPFDETKRIRYMQIQKPKEKKTLKLVLRDEDWFLDYPVQYPADKAMVEGLLSALKISHKARRLLREKDWSEYGLAFPDLKIGIEAEGVPQREYLLLGNQSPVAEMVYARWEREQEYFLLDKQFKQAFDRSPYSLREKRIIRQSLAKVDKIHIRTAKGDYEIYRQEDEWFWTEPVAWIGKKISEPFIYSFLTSLRDLYVKDFLEDFSLDQGGFSRSGPSIQVWTGEKNSFFRVGKEVINQDAYYGMLEGEKVAFLVARGNVQSLFKLVENAVVKTTSPADPAAVETNPVSSSVN